MQQIIIELKVIEEHFINVRYLEAYETLYHLCRDNPACQEFSSAAMNLLARHNDLEKNIMMGVVDPSQQDIRQREIRYSFQMLLTQLKRCFPAQYGVKPPDTEQHSAASQDKKKAGTPIKLFYSYSHKDEMLREKLETHLKLLKRQGIIDDWHDRMIEAGSEWDTEIDENMQTANIILLLISADFLASDYCYGKELKHAMQRHHEKSAKVIPIALRPCDTSDTDFMKLQGLPKNFKPVTRWSDQDDAFMDIAKGIRDVAKGLKGQK